MLPVFGASEQALERQAVLRSGEKEAPDRPRADDDPVRVHPEPAAKDLDLLAPEPDDRVTQLPR